MIESLEGLATPPQNNYNLIMDDEAEYPHASRKTVSPKYSGTSPKRNLPPFSLIEAAAQD